MKTKTMTKPINRAQIELPGTPAPERRLTPKQKRFIIGYLTHFNGTRAAIEAGYSRRSARYIASENLSKPHILRYIDKHLKSYELSTQEIIAKLGAMARGEIPTKTVQKGETLEIHHDEIGALQSIAKAHGLFVDRHQLERVDNIQVVEVDEDNTLLIADNGKEPDPEG